jgi:hypothetical protein
LEKETIKCEAQCSVVKLLAWLSRKQSRLDTDLRVFRVKVVHGTDNLDPALSGEQEEKRNKAKTLETRSLGGECVERLRSSG